MSRASTRRRGRPSMDVSVIIVTRNTRVQTCAAVRSVLESQDRLAKEVFVVDNGSSDDTPTVLPSEYPSVHFIRSETNLGFGRANNLGAKTAQGRFLLLLNSDARLQSGSLAKAVDYLESDPACGIVGAQLLNPDGSRQNSIANFPSLATELLNKSLLRRLFPRRYPGKERVFEEPTPVETAVGAFLLIRRATWEAVGGFDERFFFFFEETDFCLQTARCGWSVMHVPQVRVWHDQGQTAKTVAAAARVEYWRSRYLYFAKNHSPGTGALLRAGLRVRLLADALAALLLVAVTLGRNARLLHKWQVYRTLLRWHARGRPVEMGLPRMDLPAHFPCGGVGGRA